MTEYVIERLGLHGDGVVKGPLYAAQTLPGEVVTGQIQGQTLTDVRIVTSSPQRVRPPCRHFKACGGCALQHASDDFVAGWKQQVVRTALQARGIETTFRPLVTSPAGSRRRATFAARRTKKGALAGFFGRASDVIIEIPDCLLVTGPVKAGLEVAEAVAIAGASRKSALSVAITESVAGLDVVVLNGKPLDRALRQTLALLTDLMGLARLTWDDEVIAVQAPPVQRFGKADVVPPPGAFLQATREGEAALVAGVRNAVAAAGNVIDLFAGCGTFSLPLAESAAVHAVEGERDMIAALEEGWRRTGGLKPLTAETRDLFRRPLLPDELARADAVVLDPPRAGAEAQVSELARARVPCISYVSCNPVTFARDADTLIAAGYRLDWVQVVDQFRWSPHIELVACLSRAA